MKLLNIFSIFLIFNSALGCSLCPFIGLFKSLLMGEGINSITNGLHSWISDLEHSQNKNNLDISHGTATDVVYPDGSSDVGAPSEVKVQETYEKGEGNLDNAKIFRQLSSSTGSDTEVVPQAPADSEPEPMDVKPALNFFLENMKAIAKKFWLNTDTIVEAFVSRSIQTKDVVEFISSNRELLKVISRVIKKTANYFGGSTTRLLVVIAQAALDGARDVLRNVEQIFSLDIFADDYVQSVKNCFKTLIDKGNRIYSASEAVLEKLKQIIKSLVGKLMYAGPKIFEVTKKLIIRGLTA